MKLNKLEQKLNVKFKNKKLLKKALVHRSYLNEHPSQKLRSNERLEFLGDAVLELWATEMLFRNFPNLPEGVLTNIRSAIVRTESLAKVAKNYSIGDYLYLSKGESISKGRHKNSLLADSFESVVGAIYLDQGWKKVAKFLDKSLKKKLMKLGKKGDVKDAKTKLQEHVQATQKITPHYEIIDESGPDHQKQFTAAVYFDDKQITKGKGGAIKEAEENAALKALTKLGVDDIITSS